MCDTKCPDGDSIEMLSYVVGGVVAMVRVMLGDYKWLVRVDCQWVIYYIMLGII